MKLRYLVLAWILYLASMYGLASGPKSGVFWLLAVAITKIAMLLSIPLIPFAIMSAGARTGHGASADQARLAGSALIGRHLGDAYDNLL